MARKRMIDPSFWIDEKLGECCIQARLLFMGLISNADDEGRGRANAKIIKSTIFPYDDIKTSDIEKWLEMISCLNLATIYQVDGQQYYNLPNFRKHQTINKPTKSVIPAVSLNTTVALQEDYGSTTVALPPKRKEEKRIEVKRREKKTIEYEQKFEEFWSCYPKKIGKGKAKEKFIILANNNDTDLIIKGASDYADWCNRNNQEAQFIPHPTTWLNQERWSDELMDRVAPQAPKSAWQTEKEVRAIEQDKAAEKLKAMFRGDSDVEY